MKGWKVVGVVAAVCAFVLTASFLFAGKIKPSQKPQSAQKVDIKGLNLTVENYPNVDGSTSAHPLHTTSTITHTTAPHYLNHHSHPGTPHYLNH
ncbi:MAG: hypothetical protein L0922_04475, partial [Candidatus Mariimomonas ferrooxydans]